MSADAAFLIRDARRRLFARYRLVVAGLLALTAVIFVLAMSLGDYPVTPQDLVQSLLSPLTGLANKGVDFIVLNVRLPRAVVALMVGGAFGLSGIIFQTILRNPLASPDIIGIAHGASAAAVICVIGFGWGGFGVSIGAFLGAALTAAAIYGLGWRGGGSPYRMVLIGIGMAAILSAVISFAFTRARVEDVQRALAWITGSLNAISFSQAMPLAVALLVLLPLLALLVRRLGSLQMGDDTARALGVPVEVTRLALIAIAVALAAFATAATGPIAFVAFVSGPIARRLLGPSVGALVPSMLVGGCVTLGADIVGQHLIGNNQLPVGVVTGAFGAVFLIYLLIVANRGGQGAQ